MKFLAMFLLAIVIFLVAIIAPMAATGKLNRATLDRLLGREEMPQLLQAGEEDVSPLVAKIKDEQKRLQEWETDLTEKRERLEQRERSLDETLTRITEMQTEVSGAMDQLDSDQLAAIQAIAKTMEAMTAQNAAIDLESMTPENAARLLPLIKDRNRGRILDAMDPARRALILQVMQERKY